MPNVFNRGTPVNARSENVFAPFDGYIENEIVERGGMIPLAQYSDGKVRLAWPDVLATPVSAAWNAWDSANVAGRDQSPETTAAMAQQSFDAASLAPIGGALTSAAGAVPEGAVAANGIGRAASHLPMDEASRMARAKDMGFDPDRNWYHATDKNFEAFDLDAKGLPDSDAYFGKGIYLSADAGYTKGFGKTQLELNTRVSNPLRVTLPVGGEAEAQIRAIYPEFEGFPLSNRQAAAFSDAVRKAGYDAIDVMDNSGIDGRGNRTSEPTVWERVILDPKNIRRTDAAFDPARSDSANLLYSNSPTGASVPLAMSAMERSGAARAAEIPDWAQAINWDDPDFGVAPQGPPARYGKGNYTLEQPPIEPGFDPGTHEFKILKGEDPVGNALVNRDGNTASVVRMETADGSNSLGLGGIRDLREAFRQFDPAVTEFTGTRHNNMKTGAAREGLSDSERPITRRQTVNLFANSGSGASVPLAMSALERRVINPTVLPERQALNDAWRNSYGQGQDLDEKFIEGLRGSHNATDSGLPDTIRNLAAASTDPKAQEFARALDAYRSKTQRIGHNGGPDPSTWENGAFLYANSGTGASVPLLQRLLGQRGGQAATADTAALQAEMSQLQQRHAELFGQPYRTPQPPGGATLETMAADLAELKSRIVSRETQNASQPVGPSVPQAGAPRLPAVPPNPNVAKRVAEFGEIQDQVAGNPFVQTRNERGQFVKKAEEKRLINDYYSRKGEPLTEGPWGREKTQYQDVAKAQQQFEAARRDIVVNNQAIQKTEQQRTAAVRGARGHEARKKDAELKQLREENERLRSLYDRLSKIIKPQDE